MLSYVIDGGRRWKSRGSLPKDPSHTFSRTRQRNKKWLTLQGTFNPGIDVWSRKPLTQCRSCWLSFLFRLSVPPSSSYADGGRTPHSRQIFTILGTILPPLFGPHAFPSSRTSFVVLFQQLYFFFLFAAARENLFSL